MNKDNYIHKLWKQHWKNKPTLEESSSPFGNYLRHRRFNIVKKIIKDLNHSMSVLDMGCGGGATLTIFKEAGFDNIIGIDFAEESIKRCVKLGFTAGYNIFLMNAKKTTFPDNSFDIVFSEGLWEHFPDPRPYMAEACRLAKKYIIVIQPNHFSFFGRLMHLGWSLFSKNKGGVYEYSFTLGYFKDFLKMYGFKFVKSKSTILHEQAVMQFERI